MQAWLEENWDPDLTVAEWWERLGLSGWAAPGLPENAYGKGLNRNDSVAVQNAIAEFGALGAPGGLGLLLAAPTIAAHGTQEQIDLYVRDIVTGQKAWCQLFSEPGAGSDLAGLQSKAIKDGDEWIVTGQKVWTSGGQVADLGMLIARTDPDVPKHQGITYFAIDMHQKGIEIRPLVEMTGHAMFNEVFMEEAVVPDERPHRWPQQRVGGGQHHAHERARRPRLRRWSRGGRRGHARHRRERPRPKRAGDFVSARGGAEARRRRRSAGGMFGGGYKLLVELAKGNGKINDAVRPPGPHEAAHAQRARALQQPASQGGQGHRPGRPRPAEHLEAVDERDRAPAARHRPAHRRPVRHAPRLQGARTRARSTTPPATRSSAMVTGMALFAQAPPIYGGTDQVQRNIIGERVLGLPKEANNDKTAAFKDLPKNA